MNVSFLFFLISTLLLAEPSVYGFDNSYNKGSNTGVSVKQNKRSIASLKREIDKQNERIDGLISLIEGLNNSIAELQNSSHSTSVSSSNSSSIELQNLVSRVDTIDDTYVTKETLEKALSSNSTLTTTSKPNAIETKPTLDKKDISKVYSEGVRLFQKKRYNEARKRFEITDKKGHKPAASNYYMGEISYYTKNYDDAIFYFKKSAGLYDKASYMDVLLLHAGISLSYIGDKEQAKMFYENIIENYQGKNSAKIAQEKLERL